VNRRIVAFVVLAVVLAAVFARLGFWQLARRQERKVRNAAVAARLAESVVPFDQLGDSSAFRRATVAGEPDYQHEILFTGRSRNGSPGVYILTPVRRAANDTAVIVIRGWVYAPDAATADLARWREARNAFMGYVSMFPTTQPAPKPAGRRLRALTLAGVRGLLPYPVAREYLVAHDSASDRTPARLPMPALDEGPHLSYAVQWFAFAIIAIAGAAIVAFRARARESTGSTGA
jgi:surfeit locus 1 family protein